MRIAHCLLISFAAMAPLDLLASPPIPYSEARRTGGSYECRYELPSFFGETSSFRSHARGDDLYILSEEPFPISRPSPAQTFEELERNAVIHYWRIGGFHHIWRSADGMAIKFDLAAVAAAASPGKAVGMEGDAIFAPYPPGDAACTPIQRAKLDLPRNVVFRDITKEMIEDAMRALGQAFEP